MEKKSKMSHTSAHTSKKRFLKMFSAFLIVMIFVLVGIYYFSDKETKILDAKERDMLGGSYITLSDGVTHYKLVGPAGGQLVVLVHGGTVPMWTWDKQIKALNDAGFRVLVYDEYGRGYSDRPKVVYNQDLYEKQLSELLEKLGINEKFDLVGLSLGGGIAVGFAAQYPEKIQKLVLISPLIKNYHVPSILKIPMIGEFAVRTFGIKKISERFAALFEGNQEGDKYKKLFEEQTRYKGFQRSLLSMLRNNAIGDYTDSYEKLGERKRDILLIWGTDDSEINQEMITEIKNYLPGLKFEAVDGVGHGIVFQKPGVVNNLLIDFLK
jgi:pimeloyl-ACP methyl ester carboxylesterase